MAKKAEAPELSIRNRKAFHLYEITDKFEAGIELVATSENVVMCRTFSKIHALAALRLGWLYGPEHVVEAINRIRGPFNVNAPAMAAGIAAIKDSAHVEKSRAHNEQWLAWLMEEISSLGLKITETRLSAIGDYADLLELSATADGKNVSVAGAFFGATPRIVSVNSRPVEARPHGVILVLENTDRPGMVGRIGTLLGEYGVNIATMSLSRNQAGGTALTVLNLDTAPSEELLTEIRASEDIRSAQVIEL